MADRTPTPLSEDDIRSICGREITAAESHVEPLASDRMKALDFYHGKNLWPSKKGQSQVVTKDLAEAVEWMMPALLKIFTGSDEIVRFEPVGQEDEAIADQATDFVNLIWAKDNPGFLTLHTWMKDALLAKIGVIKIWWEDDPIVTSHTLGGLSQEQVAMLMQDPELEITGADATETPAGPLYDVQLKRTKPNGRVCIEPVPPEEYLYLPSVKTDADPGQGHRRRVTQSDLIASGFDAALVDDLPTADGDDAFGERSHRFDESGGIIDSITRDSRDRASRIIQITEWYTRLDINGDGLAELVKVTLGGTNESKLLDIEEVDAPPFAVLSPVLMPHKLAGLSVADLVMDLQEIKSSITRQMLNSLYLANNPRTWAVDGQVNIPELLTSQPGGVVRVKAPGMVGELNTTFVAQQAFPMLEYIDRTLEGRTGVSRMMQGMDADVLNGGGNAAMQTATGVAAMQSAAQQRVELIARVFAETGIKRAFKLILQLVTKYQQSERVVRLRNQWVPIDPRAWNADMDLTTEVGLGTGNRAEQTAQLMSILQEQKQALQAGGLGLVTPQNLYATLAKLIQLSGLKTVDPYFQDPSKAPPQPPQQPPPDPNMMAIQMQGQIEQGKLALEREKMMREDDRKRDEMDADISLKAAELQAKYGAQVNMAQIRAAVDRDREAMRQQGQLMQAQMQPPPMPPGVQ
jgi:hypothetical protein